MNYVDLNAISEQHLEGTWEVKNRLINTNSSPNHFIDVRLIELDGCQYRSINGKERKGEWRIIRENEIIYNPQIKFFINQEQVGNAIITRLQSDQDQKGDVYRLTLYFSNGLELILQKNNFETTV